MKIPARTKFYIGQRVRMTEEAIHWFTVVNSPGRAKYSTDTHATVVGFSYDGLCVWVIRDGFKSRESFGAEFWQGANPIEVSARWLKVV